MTKNKSIINAIYIGTLCAVSYFAVYISRDVLGAVTPQMIEKGFAEAFSGKVSSTFFVFYAVGQLINGSIGDKIKAKYMMSVGLFAAGVTNILFATLASGSPDMAVLAYGFTGFFLSMIYGPMTKTVAENVEPLYATRCSLGYNFASFIAAPTAGLFAAFMLWNTTFIVSSIILMIMAVICFASFLTFEKKGMVKYNQYDIKKEKGGGIKVLIKHRIIRFTFISIITGIVRTSVIFWLPTYTAQHLGFSPETSALIFTVASFVISFAAFISVFVYEKLNRNMDLTIFIMFLSAAIFFALLYIVKSPVPNIIMMTLAIMSSNGAASMLWSRYCPSLRDTGMVSGATGFLDFASYMAAAVSSTLFANAVTSIGWGNLILVWCALMVFGVLISIPKKIQHKKIGLLQR